MQGSKDNAWSTDIDKDVDLAEGADKVDTTEKAANDEGTDGWQQYRKWISKAPAPTRRRGGIDPSLYTWKGYRNWTEQVKRNWDDKPDS